MEAFEYSALPARMSFGFATLPRAANELIALGRKRAFVLSDPHHATTKSQRDSCQRMTPLASPLQSC